MNISVFIDTAFPFPAPDIEALIEGRTIAGMAQTYINPGQQFALYPCDTSTIVLPTEQYYRTNFLPTAVRTLAELDSETVLIKAWARCELCQVLDEGESLDVLSKLTVWTKEALEETLSQRGHIFLAYLRVYRLPQPVEMPVNRHPRLIILPESLSVAETQPVLSDIFFERHSRQMKKPKRSLHPELEALQGAIAPMSINNLAAKELYYELKTFLGWSGYKPPGAIAANLLWIQTIAKVGNSSDGEGFKKLVRQSLIELGFTNSNQNPKASLNSKAISWVGGLDFYCEAPYPVVGACIASQQESLPIRVSAQLLDLGYNHLCETQFDHSVKIILTAAPMTQPDHKAVVEHQMNVIRPETWQRLVELKAQHQGSINLLELKPCLQEAPFGEAADAKINSYIDKVQLDLKVRSRLVDLVKNYLHNAGLRETTVDAIYSLYVAAPLPGSITPEELHDILIELSSPLTGYLGRIKAKDWKSDRFYFLRELKID